MIENGLSGFYTPQQALTSWVAWRGLTVNPEGHLLVEIGFKKTSGWYWRSVQEAK